jgi:hypothetical protein
MTHSYYCPDCYKPKIDEWGKNLPYCRSLQCREKYYKKKMEENRLKKIIMKILAEEKILSTGECMINVIEEKEVDDSNSE